MSPQPRAAQWLLCLACLVILICMAQRMAGLQVLDQSLILSETTQSVIDSGEVPTSCELSAKSLLTDAPSLFELIFGLLLLWLAANVLAVIRFFPPPIISPHQLRIHLRLCIFRE